MRAKLHFLFVAMATVLLVGCTTSKEAASPAITVTRAKGMAQYSSDGTNWLPVKGGQKIVTGTTIRTTEEGFVDLLIGETYKTPIVWHPDPPKYYVRRSVFENRVRVYGESELSIDRLKAARVGSWWDGWTDVYQIGMSLRSGNMVGNAQSLRFASTHEVNFAGRVIHIEGGGYGTLSNSVVCVLTGHATVSVDGGDAVVVKANQQFDVAGGKVTEMPPSHITDCFPDLVPIYEPQAGPWVKPFLFVQPTPPKK